MCTHGTRFSRQVPINVRAPHTTKPLRSRREINSLRMECRTPPSSAPSLTGQLATNSGNEHSRQAPAVRAVERPGLIPVGSRPSPGPWQGTPDVSTHAGSLLPLDPHSPPNWQQTPDVCAHTGSLLPWVGSRLPRTIPYLGKCQVGLVRAAFPPAGRHSHRALAAIGGLPFSMSLLPAQIPRVSRLRRQSSRNVLTRPACRQRAYVG